MLCFIETTAVDLIPLPLAYYTLYLFAFTSLCTLQSSDQSFCWNLQKSTCFCNTVTKSHANIHIYNHSGFTAAGSDQLNVEWIHLWSHAITMNCPFTSPGQMQAFSLKPSGTTLHWIKKKKNSGFVKTLKTRSLNMFKTHWLTQELASVSNSVTYWSCSEPD